MAKSKNSDKKDNIIPFIGNVQNEHIYWHQKQTDKKKQNKKKTKKQTNKQTNKKHSCLDLRMKEGIKWQLIGTGVKPQNMKIL